MTGEKKHTPPRGDDLLSHLCAADPAAGLDIDLVSLRAKIDAAISAGADTAANGAEVNGAEVIAFRSRRRWVAPAIAAMSVAAVSVTGMLLTNPGTSPAGNNPNAVKTNYAAPKIPPSASNADESAAERLEEIGDVEFEPAAEFSEESGRAAVYTVVGGGDVSPREVQKTAKSLGLSGAVKKTGKGYFVTGDKGAKLVVTTGELASLKFSNPAAVKMKCVPVKTGSNVKPGSPATVPTTQAPAPEVQPITPVETTEPTVQAPPTTKPSATTQPELPAPVRPGTNPSPTETSKPTSPTASPAPSATVLETQPVNPSVKPGAKPGSNENGEISQSSAAELEIGNLLSTTFPATTDGEENVEIVYTNAGQNCVWKVVGDAPAPATAVQQVAKVAAAMGGTVLVDKAAVTTQGGLAKVSVPVKLDGNVEPSVWHASVSTSGVAAIDASLAKAKTVGDSPVISQAEAVKRLNDPAYGPLDVIDVRVADAAPTKPAGPVKLVSARLVTAPVKGKNGKITQIPAYQILDTEGRSWTVSALP